MSSEWPRVRLGDYCLKIGSGATPKGGKSVYLDSGHIALIRSQNVYNDMFKPDGLAYITLDAANKLNNVEVQLGDILLNITGDSVARVCLAPNEYLPARVNQHVAIIRPDPNEFDSRFLRYLLTSPEQQELLIVIASAGATRNALTKSHIESFEVCKPDLAVQIWIANQLESLDKKIQLNNQINQTLEQIAQALFKSWFVDFEPVRAKIAALEEGGILEGATLAAMTAISGKDTAALARLARENPEGYAELKATAELFPTAMHESEVGKIPEGWKLKPFGEFLSHTIGGDWGKDEPDEKHNSQVRIIRGTDIANIKNYQDRNVPTRFVEEKKLKSRNLIEGDIVIEVSGGSPTQPTGRSIFITNEILKRLSLPVEPASFCRLFRPLTKEIGIVLGLHLDKIYQEGKTWLYQNQSTGISNFQTKTFLEKEMVVLAPEAVLACFSSKISPLLQVICSPQNIILSQLRDTLLPKLLSGEITLPEAEAWVAQTEPQEV
ncbi:restriction endonuclease subunit S [Serratia fonticola]|uniref:Restriction endonuclease subunit S n=1 Tax=Serratia fonticola TaxID=47917 RepID=A0AAW3WQQ6_SERFO|nr:restriction endonuclease subunit S [Serratia fonticola]MBC3211962.1 restriction endonuclease subunit S [Serratia fonticola]NYA13523.1 restriction endonuclease subunit S [Serratia fonticola]NYA33333.1 restriction endonuclease subunit S [Serratia fonticola]